jgi:antirestriction protein ArdC
MTKLKKPPRTYDRLQAGDDTSRQRLDVHAAITEKIVAAIRAGAGDFQMPWHRPGVAFTIPKNALTDKTYRGSNVLSLWIDADAKKFEHQLWATFKQWQELGAQVRKGEKGSLIVKYGEWVPRGSADAGCAAGNEPPKRQQACQPAGKEHKDDDNGKRLFAKAAWVFNVQQVDGYEIAPTTPRPDLTERLAHVDAFIAATGAEFREGGQRAFYRHRDSRGEGDFIQIPARSLFTGTATSTPTESYESTRLHELAHWSGAGHRLDRDFGRFGDKAYSFEELVAELSAAFLCAELQITNAPRADHAQYCANWLEVLEGDTKAIFSAASLATRAVAYLDGLQPKPDVEPHSSDNGTPSRPDGKTVLRAGPSRLGGGPRT